MVKAFITVEWAASVSAAVQAGVMNATQDANSQAYETNREYYEVFSAGPRPPYLATGKNWLNETSFYPMPLSYTLETIDELVIRHLNSKTDAKVVNLKAALAQYCAYLKDTKGHIGTCDATTGNPRPVFNNGCKFCANGCGNGFSEDGGVIGAFSKDLRGDVKAFSDSCGSDYGQIALNHVHLCCNKH